MFEFTKYLPDAASTDSLAQSLAPYLMPGDVLALTGHLGAGKSHFARALIIALGSQQKHLPSPTFTLMQNYDDTRIPVAHVDFYRLGDPSEADELALDPFINHGLALIEWADNAPHVCPERTLRVEIEDKDSDTQNGRQITFKSADESWGKRFGFFMPELQRPVTEKGRSQFVQNVTGKKGQVISAVSADASFRSYWRVRDGETSYVLMDAPPPMEDLAPFVKMANYLEGIGIYAPHIYHQDADKGYLLLEDFGNKTVLDAIQDGADALPLYESAVDVLVKIAQSNPASVPRQASAQWQDEACLFTDWFLPVSTGHATHTADRRMFRSLISGLINAMPKLPETTMLKDYHCQNLMVIEGREEEESLGVLDFQDARRGTVAYDMASLLYDVRHRVPGHFHAILLQRFADSYGQGLDVDELAKGVRLIATENLLRIAGVFTRLAHRDGKTQYLDYVPLIWQYLDKLLAEEPEAAELANFIYKRTPNAQVAV